MAPDVPKPNLYKMKMSMNHEMKSMDSKKKMPMDHSKMEMDGMHSKMKMPIGNDMDKMKGMVSKGGNTERPLVPYAKLRSLH